MLKILNKYKKWLIIFSFAYIYIIAFLIAPSGFKAITPGGVDSTNDSYQISGINFNNNINTVSVYSYPEITTFQKWLIENNKRYDVSEKTTVDKELSLKDQRLQGKISHESSNDNALITAYTYANKVDSNISIEYELTALTVYYSNNPDLEVGDEILTINGNHLVDATNSYEDYLTNLDLYNYSDPNRINGKRIGTGTQLSFQRNKETLLNTRLTENQLVIFYPKYEITKTTPASNIKQLNVGGPSGGMIQTLAIYSALLNIDFGKTKIAGTGTMNSNNLNTVGKIGGLPQKYYTVKKAKADYFVIPESQLILLEDLIKPKDKVKIITVKDFDEVIEKVIKPLRKGIWDDQESKLFLNKL